MELQKVRKTYTHTVSGGYAEQAAELLSGFVDGLPISGTNTNTRATLQHRILFLLFLLIPVPKLLRILWTVCLCQP